MGIHSVECNVGTNPVTIETGKMARLADGAVTVRCGDTVVLVTAVSATKVKEGQTFFPLSVEYKGKSRCGEHVPRRLLQARRPSHGKGNPDLSHDGPSAAPLFPKGYLYDTQVIAILLSADGENDSDILSINGASAALCVSDIPFQGPVGRAASVKSMASSSSTPPIPSARKAPWTWCTWATKRRDHD